MRFINLDKTSKYIPRDSNYFGWIDFWRDKLRNVADTSNVAECAIKDDYCIAKTDELRKDLVGAHVAITDDLWIHLEGVIIRDSVFSNKPTLIDFEGIKVLLRNDLISKNRSYFGYGDVKRPAFIAPICRSCNTGLETEFELKEGTILVPLYEYDEIEK